MELIDSTEELEHLDETKLSELENKSLILVPSPTPVSLLGIEKLVYCSVSICEMYFDTVLELVTKHLSLLDKGQIFDKWNDTLNKNKRELHSTILFCTPNTDKTELIEELNPYFGSIIQVNVISIAFSLDFITLGIEFEDKIPYFQNSIKHITFEYLKGNSPMNSTLAFSNGITFDVNPNLNIKGIICKVNKDGKVKS